MLANPIQQRPWPRSAADASHAALLSNDAPLAMDSDRRQPAPNAARQVLSGAPPSAGGDNRRLPRAAATPTEIGRGLEPPGVLLDGTGIVTGEADGGGAASAAERLLSQNEAACPALQRPDSAEHAARSSGREVGKKAKKRKDGKKAKTQHRAVAEGSDELRARSGTRPQGGEAIEGPTEGQGQLVEQQQRGAAAEGSGGRREPNTPTAAGSEAAHGSEERREGNAPKQEGSKAAEGSEERRARKRKRRANKQRKREALESDSATVGDDVKSAVPQSGDGGPDVGRKRRRLGDAGL